MIKTDDELVSFLEKNDCEIAKKLEGCYKYKLLKLCDEEFVLNTKEFEGSNIPHFHLTNETRDIAICLVKPWYLTHNNEVHILSKDQLNELNNDLKDEKFWRYLYSGWDGGFDNRSIVGRLRHPKYKIITGVVFGQPETFSPTWNDILMHNNLLRIPLMKVHWKYLLRHNINYVLYFKKYNRHEIRIE